jgi:mono/diheme cytochrome c family protein
MISHTLFDFAFMKKTSKMIIIMLCSPALASIAGSTAPRSDTALGKQIFERATCQSCHPGGSNLLHPSKPLKGPSFEARFKDDAAIAKVVRNGVPNTGMPAFSKAQISDREMKLVIAYIRSLKLPTKAKTAKQAGNGTKDHS